MCQKAFYRINFRYGIENGANFRSIIRVKTLINSFRYLALYNQNFIDCEKAERMLKLFFVWLSNTQSEAPIKRHTNINKVCTWAIRNTDRSCEVNAFFISHSIVDIAKN